MNFSDIQTLFAYNRWANDRQFSALKKLSQEQFAAPIQSSFPSIRLTVFHIIFAEWLWLKRWQGASPRTAVPDADLSTAVWNTLVPAPPPLSESPTAEELKSVAELIEQERNEFLASVNDQRLHAPLHYTDMAGKPFSLPLGQLMQPLVNHGTYHRGQVTTMLRQLGAEAIGLDMSYFFREAGSPSAGA